MQPFDLALMLGRAIAVAVLERARRLIQELLLPGINLVGMNLIALGQISHRRLFPQCLQRDLRLQRCVNLASRSGRHLPLRLLRRNGLESN
jgi:hypothetical protein